MSPPASSRAHFPFTTSLLPVSNHTTCLLQVHPCVFEVSCSVVHDCTLTHSENSVSRIVGESVDLFDCNVDADTRQTSLRPPVRVLLRAFDHDELCAEQDENDCSESVA